MKLQLRDPDQQSVEVAIQKTERKYKLTPKYLAWEEAFLKKGSHTFGNATQSALLAYNLDPVVQIHVAHQIGYENMRKHDNLMAKYYKKIGKTEGTLYDIFWEMMLAKKDIGILYAIAEAMGIKLPEYRPVDKPQYVVSQQNNQVNIGGDMSLTFIKEEGDK